MAVNVQTAGNYTLGGIITFSSNVVLSAASGAFSLTLASTHSLVATSAAITTVTGTTFTATGTVTGAILSATTSMVTPALNATGTISGAVINATTSMSTTTINATGTISGNVLNATTSIGTAALTATGLITCSDLSATSRAMATSSISIGGSVTDSSNASCVNFIMTPPLSLVNPNVSATLGTPSKMLVLGTGANGALPALSTFYRDRAYGNQLYGIAVAVPPVVHSEVSDNNYHNVARVGIAWAPNKGFLSTGVSAVTPVTTATATSYTTGDINLNTVSAWEAYGGAFQVVNYVPYTLSSTLMASKVAFKMVIDGTGKCYLVRQITGLKPTTNSGLSNATYPSVTMSHLIFG